MSSGSPRHAAVPQKRILFFEDIEVGSEYRSRQHTVSKEELVAFAERWDPQPFHVDEEAGRASPFGGLIACTAHTFAIQTLLTHTLEADVALLAGLGNDGFDLLSPVRPGSTLTMVRRYTDKRESRSRPDRGIVKVEHEMWDQDDALVCRARGRIMVYRRGFGPGAG